MVSLDNFDYRDEIVFAFNAKGALFCDTVDQCLFVRVSCIDN